jgi:hypothetical protein
MGQTFETLNNFSPVMDFGIGAKDLLCEEAASAKTLSLKRL